MVTSSRQDHVSNWIFIFTTRGIMASKLCRLVTYLHLLLPTKSHNPFITWSCKITWQTKTIISPPPQCWRLSTMSGWSLILRVSYPCYSILWLRSLARSSHKLRPLYLHNHEAYGHQSWQRCGLPWGVPTHNIYDFLITWLCKITWQNKNVLPLPQRLWPRHLAVWSMVTYLEQLVPIKLHNHITMWSCKMMWQTVIIIYSLPDSLWLPNLTLLGVPMRSFLPSSHEALWSRGLARLLDKLNRLYLYCHEI